MCFCVWVESGRLDGRKWMCECFIKAAPHRAENRVGDSRDMGLAGVYGEVGRPTCVTDSTCVIGHIHSFSIHQSDWWRASPLTSESVKPGSTDNGDTLSKRIVWHRFDS